MFDTELCEVKDAGVRYVLRRNPVRAEEMAESRLSKMRSVEGFIGKQNVYLRDHPKASASKMLEKVKAKLKSLRIDTWVQAKEEGRILKIESDEEALKEEKFLDGCYVIKTDLKEDVADKSVVHDRYKDLTEVEKAFRDCKTVNLEVRPVHVRRQGEYTRTRVCSDACVHDYSKTSRKAWESFDLTVKDGIGQLATVCSMEVKIKGQDVECVKIPQPREQSRQLLEALKIKLPAALPKRDIRVVTRKNYQNKENPNNIKASRLILFFSIEVNIRFRLCKECNVLTRWKDPCFGVLGQYHQALGYCIRKDGYHAHGAFRNCNECNVLPDGKTLASASDDRTIKLWDSASGKAVATLTGHSDGVTECNVLPDGKILASGSGDGTIKLWNNILAYKINLSQDEIINAAKRDYNLELQGLELKPIKPPATNNLYENSVIAPRWPESHPFHWLNQAEKGRQRGNDTVGHYL